MCCVGTNISDMRGYNRMFKTYGIGYQYNGSWGGEVSNGTKAKVLAWRELPEPPSKVGEI